MESIETEVYLERGKSDRQGRRIRGPEEWSAILDRYDRSGLTQAEFCRQEGLKYGTLVAWLGRRRKKGGPLSGPRPPSPKFHELSLSAPPTGSIGSLEVSLPDGTVLRGSQAEELAQLVRLLRA